MAKICGTKHPTEHGLTCTRPPGTNAYNEERDENVHQHWAQRASDMAVFRWEDTE